MDYHKRYQVVAMAIPTVVLLLDQINTFPHTCSIDLANVVFCIPVSKDHQDSFLSAGMTSNIFSLSYIRPVSTLSTML